MSGMSPRSTIWIPTCRPCRLHHPFHLYRWYPYRIRSRLWCFLKDCSSPRSSSKDTVPWKRRVSMCSMFPSGQSYRRLTPGMSLKWMRLRLMFRPSRCCRPYHPPHPFRLYRSCRWSPYRIPNRRSCCLTACSSPRSWSTDTVPWTPKVSRRSSFRSERRYRKRKPDRLRM